MDAKEGSNNLVVGFLVGATSMAPGISGGVVAVLFGIYERLIDDLNHIRTKIKEDLGFLLTVGIGILIGLISFVYVIDYLIDRYNVFMMFFFVGLIMGQVPYLAKITKRGEPAKRSHIIWLAAGIIVMLCLMPLAIYVKNGGEGDLIESSGLLMGVMISFAVGAILAISKIIPGISGSNVLLALGLYVWMLTIIKEVDLVHLIPFGIGFIVAMFAFAKVMGHILNNYHHAVYYFISGLTLGSVVLILVLTDVTELSHLLIGGIAVVAGVLVSMGFSRIKRPDPNH